jgi:hypothetical protein
MLAPLVGIAIEGGCDSCDAYQEVENLNGGVWIIHVRHDPDCPELALHQGRAS